MSAAETNDVVPYPPRTLEALVGSKGSPRPSCDVRLTNDTRARRYVLWSDAPGYFVGEVWFNHARHRRKRVVGIFLAMLLAEEFAREIEDLLTDGWTTR